jgi:hypothetical protein
MENEFKVGDIVYHKTMPHILWVIDKLDQDAVICSTIIDSTLEHKSERFLRSAINLKSTPVSTVSFGTSKSRNSW